MVGITIQGKTVRIEALDILRGLFLVVILINHIALFPNIFMLFTGKSELWFSAAEGFMTVSGVLVGYIYTNKMKKQPKSTTLKLLRRSLKVYCATLLLGIFCMAFEYYIGRTPREEISFVVRLHSEGTARFILDTLTLRFAFSWAEFLSHYAIFIALAPIALWLISHSKWWLVASVSVLLWFISLGTAPADTMFIRSSWQLLFFIAMIIGAHYTQILAFFRKTFSKKHA